MRSDDPRPAGPAPVILVVDDEPRRDTRGNGSFDDGWLEIDFERRQVSRAGEPVRLSRTELRLLMVLAENAGRIVPHDELLSLVWGEEYGASHEQLRTYVKYLRRK